MPAGVALGPIYAALRAILVADGTLGDLLAPDKRDPSLPGIYTDGAVPSGAVRPYLTIGAGTQIPAHTMGQPHQPRYGWDCTVQLTAVGHGDGEDEGLAIMDAVGKAVFDGRELTGGSPGMLADYESGWCDDFVLQPTIISISSGITIRHWPAILRVYVHD